jgi:hypothetical protein
MIKQIFYAEHYWEVIVYWNVDYDLFSDIAYELLLIGFKEAAIEGMKKIMGAGKAKAVTCSSIDDHVSIVLFNHHSSKADYMNSIVHEAEHIKQAMLKAYDVEDKGEPPAYTIGYLASRMYEVFKHFLLS